MHARKVYDFKTLPFYTVDESKPAGFNLWARGLEDGAALADAALNFISESGFAPLLGFIHRAQGEVGAFGPTEVAFWNRVAERAA
jgi:hypothetical protein